MRVAERRLAEQEDVVGQVDDRGRGGAQVPQRPCPAKGLDDDPLLPHSTPIAAQLTLPSGLIVVTTVSRTTYSDSR